MQKQLPHRRGRQQQPSIFAVAFLSSALTISLACCVLFAFSFGVSGGVGPLRQYLRYIASAEQPATTKSEDRNFTEVSKHDAQGPIGIKSSLTASVAFKSTSPVAPEAPQDIVANSRDMEPELEPELEPVAAAFNGEQPANLPEGIPAMLRQSRGGRGIEIGNFRSATIDGDAEECVGLGYSMLSAVRAKEDLLDVMVANKQITIAKICAANGTVVLSCRNGKISISPRRARPDDSCVRA
jgi:hypothetical protein